MRAKLAKGDTTSVLIDNTMMALKWMDKRQVCMLTTIHDDSMMTKIRRTRRAEGGQEEIKKPVVVEQYNRFMGGVDRSDQLLSYYRVSSSHGQVVEKGNVPSVGYGCGEWLYFVHHIYTVIEETDP